MEQVRADPGGVRRAQTVEALAEQLIAHLLELPRTFGTVGELLDGMLSLAVDAATRLGELVERPPPLTVRQREIAILVARGCTNREIAAMLAISANAVKKHVSRALVRLDVSNRTELAALAARWPVDTTPEVSSGSKVSHTAA